MFQPETEDMLPRMAPKPSAAVLHGGEGIVRPQVPEVSILFGQQENNLPQQVLNCVAQQQQSTFKNNQQQPQTYASWKKQMLPKVNYPPSAAAVNVADMQLPETAKNNMIIHDYNTPRPNLYPLRSSSTAPNINMAGNVNTNGFGTVTNPLSYRHSLESCNNNVAFQQMQHLTPITTQTPFANLKPSNNSNTRDVLTICAGTQTDSVVDSPNRYGQNGQPVPWSDLACRADVEDLRQIMLEMQHEQQRIAKMLETLLFNNHQNMIVKTQSRDIAVQVESIENDTPPYINGGIGFIPESQSLPKNKFLQHLKPANNMMQTPKGKPMAQSTTYRANSPQSQPEIASAPTYQQTNNNHPTVLPKSASDTSLAMNELALKYLPNEKLAELLKELNMNCPATAGTNEPTTPVRGNMDKFEKGPSDISNASYKYLKKYRLLPEDHDDDSNNNNNKNKECEIEEGELENVNENQMPIYNSPQYNNIRNTPINQRHTPSNKCSPYYAGRLPLSPLARASPPPLATTATTQQNIVNLENIKHQPKFL